MAHLADLRALVEAQAPSLPDAVKTELAEVAHRLSVTHPDTNVNVVARAFQIVPLPQAAPSPPAAPTFDQAVTALLNNNDPALSNDQKAAALTVVAKVKAKNASADAATCVRVALQRILG